MAGKTIRWIVPYSAGGGYDVYSRLIEPFLEDRIAAEIVVTNVPGSGGIIGTKTLAGSPADGLTLGLINASGLLGARLSGNDDAPDPAGDLSILGRVGRVQQLWVTGPASGLESLEDVWAKAEGGQPIVMAATDVGGNAFITGAVTAHILGFDAAFVAGYEGTRAVRLAVMQGDTDIGSIAYSSVRDAVEAGDVIPLLQVSDTPLSRHESLGGVPLLGGPGGVAAQRATALGRDPSEAERLAAALIALVGAGRVVAAPAGLDPALRTCLDGALSDALADESLVAAASDARRPLDPASADETLAGIRRAMGEAEAIQDILEAALDHVRQ